jgi:flavin-dependent dehydrogenase
MSYDLIVIGTCPSGYVCAIRAAQLGLNVSVLRRHAEGDVQRLRLTSYISLGMENRGGAP